MRATGLDCSHSGTHTMNYFDIRRDHTYTADEVREIIEGQGNDFRKAFDELAAKLENEYRTEIERLHGNFSQVTTKWDRLNRWSTWGCWAMFWLSGFLFRPFFDMVWRHL